ncbi:hypothetical protein DKM19_36715 [Streptosporangium sp. 'caverna']|nr:hypothetical protein DKM19_36715 [Streptosporangium sp. 'caverna']
MLSASSEDDAGVPDTGVSDSGLSDSGVSDAGVSDAGVFDGGVSDSVVSDGGVSDAGTSDAGVPVSNLAVGWKGTLSTGNRMVAPISETSPSEPSPEVAGVPPGAFSRVPPEIPGTSPEARPDAPGGIGPVASSPDPVVVGAGGAERVDPVSSTSAAFAAPVVTSSPVRCLTSNIIMVTPTRPGNLIVKIRRS